MSETVIAVILATGSFDRTLTCVFCPLGFSDRPLFGFVGYTDSPHSRSQWFLSVFLLLKRDCRSSASCGLFFLVAVVVCAVVVNLAVL